MNIFQQKQYEELKKKQQSGQLEPPKAPSKQKAQTEQKSAASQKTLPINRQSSAKTSDPIRENFLRKPSSSQTQEKKWYKGSKPTEVETLAKIATETEKNREFGQELYGYYEQAKQEGVWAETYDKATSSYMTSLGLTPDQVNEDFFLQMLPEMRAGTLTAAGNQSSGKKNKLAYELEQLRADWTNTVALENESNNMAKEIQYWVDLGLTDDEIRQKVALDGAGASNYKKLAAAQKKTLTGEVEPTTKAIAALTSYGVDGMIWAARNPGKSTGDYKLDAVQGAMGRGAASPTQSDPRRDVSSASYAPYAVGMSGMDEYGIKYGRTSFDEEWLNSPEGQAVRNNPDTNKDFGVIYDAVEKTKTYKAAVDEFVADIRADIEDGVSPDKIFSTEMLDDYPEIRDLLEAQAKRNPLKTSESLNFDLEALYKEAETAYVKNVGKITSEEYEADLSEKLGVPSKQNSSTAGVHTQKQQQLMTARSIFARSATPEEKSVFATISPGYADTKASALDGILNGTSAEDQTFYSAYEAADNYAAQFYLPALNQKASLERELAAIGKYEEFLAKWEPILEKEGQSVLASPEFLKAQGEAEYYKEVWQRYEGNPKAKEELLAAIKNEDTILARIDANYADANKLNKNGKEAFSVKPILDFVNQFNGYVPERFANTEWGERLVKGESWDAVSKDVEKQKATNDQLLLMIDTAIRQADHYGIGKEFVEGMTCFRESLIDENKMIEFSSVRSNKDFSSVAAQFDATEGKAAEASKGWFGFNVDNAKDLPRAEVLKYIIIDPTAAQGITAATHNDDSAPAVRMNDSERETYKYIYMTEGAERAAEYFDSILPMLNVRGSEEFQAKAAEQADTFFGSVVATALSVVANTFGGLAGSGALFDAVANGKELDPYSFPFWFTQYGSTVRSETKENLSKQFGENSWEAKALNFAYDVATTTADSIASNKLAGSAGLYLMSANAGSSAAMDVLMRGGTEKQAMQMYALTSFAEAASEWKAFDHLSDLMSNGLTSGFKKELIKQFTADVSGELANEIFTNLTDQMIMGELSNWELAKNQYIAEGMSEEDAIKKANGDVWRSLGYTILMSGGSSAGRVGTAAGLNAMFKPKGNNIRTKAETALYEAAAKGASMGDTAATVEAVMEAMGSDPVEASAAAHVLTNVDPNVASTTASILAHTEDPSVMDALRLGALVPDSQTGNILSDIQKNGATDENVADLIEASKLESDVPEIRSQYGEAVKKNVEAISTINALLGTDGKRVNELREEIEGYDERIKTTRWLVELESRHVEESRRKRDELHFRFKNRPNDTKLAKRLINADRNYNIFQERLAKHQEGMETLLRNRKELASDLEKVRNELMTAARTNAQAVVQDSMVQMQQRKAEAVTVADEQRQSDNALAIETENFIRDNFPDADLTDEETEKISALMRERDADNRSARRETAKANLRWATAMSKKFGVQITFRDTSEGGKYLRYNGMYDPKSDSIVIDSNATQSDVIYGILLHELTHKAERSETYTEYANAILSLKYGNDSEKLAADIRAKQKSYNSKLKKMADLDPNVDATELTSDEASREIVADLTREILYGDEESIQKLCEEKPGVAKRILETIKNLINKLRGVKDPAVDQLNHARELFEKALGESIGNTNAEGGKQYLIEYTKDNNPVVVIEEDILKGVPRTKWISKTAEVLRTRFPNGLQVGSNVIKLSDDVGEFTRSKYSQKLMYNKKKVFADKMRIAANADEVVKASHDYVNEEAIHEHKHITDFARGEVTLQIGENWYDAEVVVGNDDRGWLRFYDVVAMNPIQAKEKKTSMLAVAKAPVTENSDLSADNVAENKPSVKQEIKTDSGEVAADIIRGGVTRQYSLASWTAKERKTVRDTLVKNGYAETDVDKWISDVDGVASIVANDKARLDYEADPDQVMLKNNQEYVKTLDASTLCAKRLLYQGTFNEIQHMLPNTVLTSDDLLDLLNIMKDAGYETPCGICYVESRRRHLGKFAEQWLNGRPATKEQKAWEPYSGEYIPTLDELTTTDGLANLKKEHPAAYNDFMKKMRSLGSSNPKIVELRTDYRGDIRKLTASQREKITKIGGLRVQSFSDFETPHLLDMMQAVVDMAGGKLTSQAYTKVPNFAWVFGDTGIKINLSLIADGTGLDSDGNLVFSSSEGMDFDEAMRLRERYSKNVGTILVGVSDDHIRAAMNDPRIDYIIPFHRSGWGQNELKKVSVLQSYTDYQATQNERMLDGSKPEGGNLYPIDYWDYDKSGDENAAIYLKLCETKGRIPKFEQFLTKDADGHWVAPSGYWKMLIDFKMYDNDGNGAPQQVVQPNFNMQEAERVLSEYKGGANTLPVAYDIVDRFVSEYKAANPRQQYALPSDNMLAEMVDSYLMQNDITEQSQRPQGERQFVRQTMPNTEAVPEWIWREFQNNPDELNYDIDTNREQVERGWQRIQQEGHDVELNRLMEADRFSADDTAEANLMMAMALHNDDPATFMALASKYNKEGTEAGKELQARKLFSKMTPTGARIWIAGRLENGLGQFIRGHQPMKERIDRTANEIANEIRNLDNTNYLRLLESNEDVTINASNNRWGTPINAQQQALIDHYNLNNVARPGIFYNRATTEQRMLEAILATPNPLEITGNGLNLIQRLEFIQNGAAVVTNADLNYIGARLGEFIGNGAETGGRNADVAIARAYEAFGNITPSTAGEKYRTWRYISMLTSVPSALRNVIGNVTMNAVNATAHGVAVEIDKIVSSFTGHRTAEHLSVNERVAGWNAFVEETKNTFRDYFVDRVTTQRGNDRYSTNQRGRVFQNSAFEAARNVESFMMSFGDRNVWRKAYVNSLAEQQKLADQNLLFNADGTTRTHDQMIEQAEHDANYATFSESNRMSNLLGQMKQIPGIGPVVDFIMPFTGVPVNITNRMIQYAPTNLVVSAFRAGCQAVRGQTFDQQAFVQGMSRGLTGTALFGVGLLLAEMGAIKLGTGEEEDKKKYGLQTAMGEQYTPYIYNPFTDEYVSLAVFSPAASSLTMGAAAWMDFKDNKDALQALKNATFGSIDQIFDASYMSGIADLFGGYGSFGERLLNTLFNNVVSQSVPTVLGQLANSLDPYVRDTKDKSATMQALKSGVINKIPFLREQLLPVKIDVTGQPVRTKEGLRNFYDPFTTTDARNEPVVDELFRLNEVLGSSSMLPSDALSGTKDSITFNKQTVTLDEAGKEAYRRRYGELWLEGGVTLDKKGKKKTVEGLRELMESRRYQRMDDEEKAEAIAEIIKAADTGVKMEALRDYGNQ